MDELSNIQNKIHVIRGYRVMLDFDLAVSYGIETRALKQAVRRNIKRFPDDFMFEITRDEYNSLRSQIVILEIGRGKYAKYLPFAFTEQGVAMLSSVLNSEPAIATNIKIMRAFVAVRQLILNPPVDRIAELQNEVRELKQYVDDVFSDYNAINEDTRMQLELINESLAELHVKNKALTIDDSRLRVGYAATRYLKKDEID